MSHVMVMCVSKALYWNGLINCFFPVQCPPSSRYTLCKNTNISVQEPPQTKLLYLLACATLSIVPFQTTAPLALFFYSVGLQLPLPVFALYSVHYTAQLFPWALPLQVRKVCTKFLNVFFSFPCRLSGPIYEKLKKTTNRYYVHVWKSEEY